MGIRGVPAALWTGKKGVAAAGLVAGAAASAAAALTGGQRRVETIGVLGFTACSAGLLRLTDEAVAEETRRWAQLQADNAYHQAESLLELHDRIPGIRFSGLRDMAISPDACLHLIDLLEQHRPRFVLELGSGWSTVVIASTLQRLGDGGRVLSIDHGAQYAEVSQRRLSDFGLSNAEVRIAPLRNVKGPGLPEDTRWYDLAAFDDVVDIDLLFVDGPPRRSSPAGRSPALTYLADRIARNGVVALDDADRTIERRLALDLAERRGVTAVFPRAEKGFAVVAST